MEYIWNDSLSITIGTVFNGIGKKYRRRKNQNKSIINVEFATKIRIWSRTVIQQHQPCIAEKNELKITSSYAYSGNGERMKHKKRIRNRREINALAIFN